MSEDANNKPPRSFYIISVAALLWNVIGVMQYIMRVTMSDAALSALPENQQAFIQDSPSWAIAAFAIATNAGALGCVLLLLRNAWAYPVLVASLLGILVQNFHGFVIGGGLDVFGPIGAVLTAVVFVIGVYLIWFSMGAKDKGWIS